MGGEEITPIHLDGTPSKPLQASITLPASLPNTIVKVEENQQSFYDPIEESDTGVEFVTKILARIDGRENSYIKATCGIPAVRKYGRWMPVTRVPTVAELKELFKEHFVIQGNPIY